MTVPAESVIDGVFYPQSDGVPMGESDVHIELLAETLTGLRAHRRDVPDLYVACVLLVYYEKGVPSRYVVPDIFAVRGVGRHPRTSWFTWLEGAGPEFVLEVTSEATYLEDQGSKKALYAELGVKEYFLFDPQDCYLKPCLQGYRLVGGEWERLAGSCLRSEVLGVDFLVEDDTLRMVDAFTGERILRRAEWDEARKREAEARPVDEAMAQTGTRAWEEAETRAQRETRARQEAEIRAQEEAEARLREAEARQAAEETVRQERQARLREAEARQAAEETVRQEREARLREAEARQAAEEALRRERQARQALEAELARLRSSMANGGVEGEGP